MQIRESISMALNSVLSNKLRAFLTLFSISIGVLAIVGVGAAVETFQQSMSEQLSAMGTNSFTIQRMPEMSFGGGGGWRRYRNRKPITIQQASSLKERMTLTDDIGISNETYGAVVQSEYESTDPNITVFGCDEMFVINFDYGLQEGRTIDGKDVQIANDVVVLGADVAERLFPTSSPIDQNVKINGHRYTVIGVLNPKGPIFGQSQDNIVLAPITSAARYFFDRWGASVRISIKANSPELLQETVDQAMGSFRIIRGVTLGQENDFELITNEALTETFLGFTDYIQLFGLLCGSVALAAAAFGIMNIMLVSVKERTREIGIRKAIGATKGNILSQFMVEAITLCQLGAIIGTLMGLGGGALMGMVLDATPVVPWERVAISISACLVVGLLAGVYPAWKASNLDPIDALRYE